ncbi:phenylalanine--tRNA ligase subunit beta [Candidatus Nanobsidianus stetteri]|uniref:phenylalanine--tRNA ligase n=1 Tax=Nanobsidianus stetteri TaxID=1294122 RepID=A0A2T9WM13_NANST|nr:phenylalanine--tRNA ligase subunit beta [Candidatus Nanobsidianus stetteri]MCC5446873.1 phenylalanine--tRNA ligase subunit beta [Candidatus Nanobsidianus stetteri]
MVVLDVSLNELYKLLNKNLSEDELNEYLLNIKCELDEIEGNNAKIEVKDFNRIDLYSITGIARELKGILNIETGIPKFEIKDSNYDLIVDKEILNVRPYIVGAVVKNVELNEDRLKDLIQLQEKISQSFGRNRQKVAIGTHNFDLIKFPVYYKLTDPETKFIPLGFNKELSLKEILENTEAGKKYSYILNKYNKYPILIDSNNNIISFPPIINSNKIGRLNINTKNIFIDVSGTDLEKILLALNVIVLTLKDFGGEIYSINVIYPDKKIKTPELKIIKKEMDLNKIKKYLGIEIDNNKIVEYLNRKRMNAKIENNKLIIEYLNYRNDILSEYDIIEEILISYGYNNLKPREIKIYTKGGLSKERKIMNNIRKIMVNMGCIEIYTPILSNKDINNLLNEDREIIELINPVSSSYNSIRVYLLSSFLQLLSENNELKFPAKIFELNRISYIKNNKIIEDLDLLYIYSDYEVSVNDSLKVLKRLFKELIIDFDIRNSNHKFLIDGRQGDIFVNNENIGWIGEIDPNILEKLGIKYPLTGFEISIKELMKYIKYDI